MAEQPTVPLHPEDVELEDIEEEAPSVSLLRLMDVMTKRFEQLLAKQDERRTFVDGRLEKIRQTFDSRVVEITNNRAG